MRQAVAVCVEQLEADVERGRVSFVEGVDPRDAYDAVEDQLVGQQQLDVQAFTEGERFVAVHAQAAQADVDHRAARRTKTRGSKIDRHVQTRITAAVRR